MCGADARVQSLQETGDRTWCSANQPASATRRGSDLNADGNNGRPPQRPEQGLELSLHLPMQPSPEPRDRGNFCILISQMGNLRCNKVKDLTPSHPAGKWCVGIQTRIWARPRSSPPPPHTAAVLREGSSITYARESRAKDSTLSLLAKAPLNMELFPHHLRRYFSNLPPVFSQWSAFPRGFI